MTTPAVAALILFSALPTMCQTTTTIVVGGIPVQVGPMADTEDSVQWKILAKRKNIDSNRRLEEEARASLVRSKKIPYEFQRVEVTGVASADDTNETLPDMIDKQVKTSNLAEVLPSGSRLKDAWNWASTVIGKDLRQALSDTRGIPSERSEKIIADLRGVRINEIFAHSWGTEVVYLGILSGDIIPPKKLVIMGVPEDNQEKWLMLAKYTGIEVHVVGFELDKLKIAGTLATQLKSGLPQDTAGLKKLWSENCASRAGRGCVDPEKFVPTKFEYNVHIVPPHAAKDAFFNGNLSELDHEKMLYYTYLEGRNLFRKTVEELDAPQMKLIKVEEKRILAEALDEAQSLVAQAREQVEIAHRDHDERLRNTYLDLADRSCTNPGSVTQAELDGLPKPYDKDFVAAPPEGVDACRMRVFRQMQNGDCAACLQSAPPPVAVDVGVYTPPTPAAQISPNTPFHAQLPLLKNFAVAACATAGQVPLDPELTRPLRPFEFYKDMDDSTAENLAAGLGVCEGKLFRRLIALIRAGQGDRISAEWVQQQAAIYRAPADTSSNYAPPSGGTPGRGRRCEDYGNINCPK